VNYFLIHEKSIIGGDLS